MNTYELNTARNCLRIIIKQYGIKELFMPYYICSSVWQACRAENCAVKFYHIDDNFFPVQKFDKDDYVLYPNYFGICSNNVLKLASIQPKLIVDNAHALYMEPCGLASFYSYRKFLNVSDGAKLCISATINLPIDDYKYDNIPQNYSEFVQNELRLNNEPPKFINECTKKIINSIDFEKEKSKRLQKFYDLDKKLNSTNEIRINLKDNDIPFVYPYLSDNKLDIETFRYWNALPKSFPEYKFYKKLKPVMLSEAPYLK